MILKKRRPIAFIKFAKITLRSKELVESYNRRPGNATLGGGYSVSGYGRVVFNQWKRA